MKHLKKFENFELNRFEDTENQDPFVTNDKNVDTEGDFEVFYSEEDELENEDDYLDEDGEELEDEDGEEEVKDWNDAQVLENVVSFESFINEERKFSKAQLAAQKKFKERIKGKKDKKSDEESEKPDFLDLNKDGNKKESMKKAAKDKKEKETGKKEEPIKKVPLKGRILKSQNKK